MVDSLVGGAVMAGGNLFTPAEDAAILDAHERAGGKRGWATACAKEIGRGGTSVFHRWTALTSKQPSATPPDEFEHASSYTDRPQSVDDMVRLFKIDLTVWEPYHVTPNVWQMGAKHPETGEIIKAPLYQTKVRFRRKPNATAEQLKAQLLTDIDAASKRRAKLKKILRPLARKVTPDGLMFEVNVFDLHLSKLAWAEETGQNYDTRIAEDIARAAVSDLLAQARGLQFAQVLLPFGNDFFHYDTPGGTTTSGTPLDRDTRYQKMFRRGWALMSWMIEACAEIAPVHVPVIPGNHDQTAAFCMGVVLEAEFARDPRVTFDNSAAPRKYYRFGKTLLGYTHGHEEPKGKLPQLMALERPADWAASTCREFHVGHFHTGKKAEPLSVDDQTGVTVRWIRSLSGTDAWHAKKAFVGNQQNAEAFVWRASGGMRAHYVSLPVDELLRDGEAA